MYLFLLEDLNIVVKYINDLAIVLKYLISYTYWILWQSLEDEIVSDTVLTLASLESWHSLSYGRFQVTYMFSVLRIYFRCHHNLYMIWILWCLICFFHLQMELCFNPDLIKKWKKMIRKEAKEAAKRGEPFDPSTTLEVQFLRNLIEEFLEVKFHTSKFWAMLVVCTCQY